MSAEGVGEGDGLCRYMTAVEGPLTLDLPGTILLMLWRIQ